MEFDATIMNNAAALLTSYGVNLASAALILIVGWIVANWIHGNLRKLMDRTAKIDATLRPVIASIVRYVILIFVLIAVLARFGVQTTSIIAILGAAGLAVGLALQGTLQNIAAGFMLLFLRPFKVGDYIDAGGIAGTVDEIGLFVTEFTTYDGLYLAVPNSKIWGNAVINYSRLPSRRADIVVGISYDDDIDRAQSVLLELMQKDGRPHADPEPRVLVKALGESSVDLNLRCWVDAGDYWNVLFDFNKAAKQRLDAAGISIPFPQRDVHLIAQGDSTES